MSIETTYREFLVQQYISNKLKEGQVVSAEEVQKQIQNLIDTQDLSVPQFIASGHYVEFKESASATKFNSTFNTIHQDLFVLYKEMLRLSSVSIDAFERWDLEAKSLERKLINLEDRVDDLLLLAQDTEGYFYTILDDFVDLSLVDPDNTTAKVDLVAGEVTMQETSTDETVTRIFLNDLTPESVSFLIRNTSGNPSSTDGIGTSLLYPFKQESLKWWTTVSMNKLAPVTAELTVELASSPIDVTKIFVELNDSVRAGNIYITPMYSTDNVTYYQLPTNTYSQEIRTKATFSFSKIQARWIKFIITKKGPDRSTGGTSYEYQFGFKNIAFYNEGFNTSAGQVFVSKPLYIVGQDSSILEFNKLTLETCERIEDNTDIVYDITTSNNSSVPITSETIWTRISPLNRTDGNHPTIISIGDITEVTIGDSETVTPSFSALATSGINPAANFRLLSLSSGNVTDTSVSGITDRYRFINPDDRILNYQIKDSTYSGSGNDALEYDPNSLIIFRNVGEKGLTPGDTTQQVRGIQRGWTFNDPYYSCVVEILNPEGFTLGDIGSSKMIIDDKAYTGTIDNTILTGKTDTQSGIHRIKVHKNNWKEVTPGATTESQLKSLDPIYPYNHKLLIEGYNYGSGYAGTQLYQGVDMFAAIQMQQVGTFEFLYNIASNNFNLFATDRDAPGTHNGGNQSTEVFLIKVDEENPDFQNERFMIRFKLLNDLRKYLRLRAILSTEDNTVAPSIDSYKLKLG